MCWIEKDIKIMAASKKMLSKSIIIVKSKAYGAGIY